MFIQSFLYSIKYICFIFKIIRNICKTINKTQFHSKLLSFILIKYL